MTTSIIESLDVKKIVDELVINHKKDAEEFLSLMRRIDIVLSVNELAYGLTICGFLNEDSHTKFEAFIGLHLYDQLEEILKCIVSALEARNFPNGPFTLDSGLQIYVVDFNS